MISKPHKNSEKTKIIYVFAKIHMYTLIPVCVCVCVHTNVERHKIKINKEIKTKELSKLVERWT